MVNISGHGMGPDVVGLSQFNHTAMNSPSRPTPAHAHLSQTLAWLLAQQQNAELEASRLRECLDWLDSIVSDDADEHQEKASRAALAVEGQLVAANNRAVTAAQAAEALGFFHR